MRRLLGALMTLLVALLAVAVSPGAAQAHNLLVSSYPADGQVLPKAPTAIVLTFEEATIPDSTKLTATSSSGAAIALPPATATAGGVKQSAAWPEGTPDGSYTVSWRSGADDGHVMSGTFTFSYAAASSSASSSASLRPSPRDNPTVSPAASSPAASSAQAGPVAGPGTMPANPGSGSDEFNWLVPAWVAVGIIVLAAAAGLVLRRIRKKDQEAE